jgi:hypothetical protein
MHLLSLDWPPEPSEKGANFRYGCATYLRFVEEQRALGAPGFYRVPWTVLVIGIKPRAS